MVELLDKLLAESDWTTALKLAHSLLLEGGHSASDLAHIHQAICRAYMGLGEYLKAIPFGELARKLARDLGEWDLFGTVCNELCAAYGETRQYTALWVCAMDFLKYKHHYRDAAYREGLIYINLGSVSFRRRNWAEAAHWYEAALTFHKARGELEYMQWARLGLIRACLYADPQRVPGLLRDSRRTLRNLPRDHDLWRLHRLAAALYAYHRKQYERAIFLARPAVYLPSFYAMEAIHADLLISRSACALGDAHLAFAHALAARGRAVQEGLYDKSYEAIELIYNLIQAYGTRFIRELEPEYRSVGVDLTSLITIPDEPKEEQ